MGTSRTAAALCCALAAGCARGPGSYPADTGTDLAANDGLDIGDGACVPRASTRCVSGAVHSYDSCGTHEGLLYECSPGVECEEVTADRALCRCEAGTIGGSCEVCGALVLASAPAGGDGATWDTAIRTLQEGIDAARDALALPSAPPRCEVWVAQGTYHVYSGAATDTVRLRAGVDVYGGFTGVEGAREERDAALHVTRIDGGASPGSTERVYHVVTAASDAVLDGFTVTGGHASAGFPNSGGAGLFAWAASPTIVGCTFTDNRASTDGGAIMGWEGSSFTIESCLFWGNEAGNDGGALHVSGGTTSIVGCFFADNAAGGDGGALASSNEATLDISTSVFRGNTAVASGGSIHSAGQACTVTGSTVTAGSAATAGGIWIQEGTGLVTGSILWGDTAQEMGLAATASCLVSHSDVQGGAAGTGNIDADPLFAGPDDLHLLASSPCIDAADGSAVPALDIEGNSRVDDPATTDTGAGTPSWADMGAYEYQP